LRRGQLVVVLEHQLWCRAAAVDGEQRVSTPGELMVRGAARAGAAAPLVGEHHRGAVVVEVRRVPVGEVLIGHRVDPDRVGRVGDVDEYAVALAGTGGQPDLREGRDVVAGVRVGGRGVPGPGRRALTRVGTRVRGPGRAVLQSVDLPHLVLEEACLVDHLGSSGVCHRHLDDLDHPHRRVVAGGISLATTIGNEALRGVDGLIGVALVRGAVVVDVNVVRVAGILYQPVGVRTA